MHVIYQYIHIHPYIHTYIQTIIHIDIKLPLINISSTLDYCVAYQSGSRIDHVNRCLMLRYLIMFALILVMTIH